MNPFSGLRMRLVATVFVATAPACIVMYLFELPWMGFIVGLLALGAAWFGGEHFILREVRVLLGTARRLTAGDLTSRTQLPETQGELGELAKTFDQMAASLQARALESEAAGRLLSNRAQQQRVVAALGQFALVSQDFNALVGQAITLVGQALEVEFTHLLELQPDGAALLMRAGVGWKPGYVGSAMIEASGNSQAAFMLTSGEPVVIKNMREEKRFVAPPLLIEHGIISGVSVVVASRQGTYGMLAAYTGTERTFTGDEINFMLSVATALGLAADRSRTDAELHKLAAFAQLSPDPAMELADDGTITYFNDATLELAQSVHCDHPRAVLPADVTEIVRTCLATGQSKVRYQTQFAGRTLDWAFHPVAMSRAVHCYVEDSTERLILEAQLLHLQKMESVGLLAAGVAHDFNNLLTVIQGHSGMIMDRPELPPPLLESAQAIFFASERATALTRQLLMFSRKNVMRSTRLDLREVVTTMTKMLQRILGETITLTFQPPPKLPLVQGDVGMMEQVLMNLVVNARDAMPKGGTLTITLEGTEISEDFVRQIPEARVGAFVCLRVSDTGTGMDAGIISRIFEPFFTTKGIGQGTGLGLATVYGIVKQHNGWVGLTSEVGKGSTFRIYLPAQSAQAPIEKLTPNFAALIRGGKETILIVEDEPLLRELAQSILVSCGYHIHAARSGRQALEIWEQQQGAVDLLLTDMVMPEGVSGVELAERLLARKPALKVIFASGYTVDGVSEAFLARNNARFMHKPYTRATLALTVRQALDSASASAS